MRWKRADRPTVLAVAALVALAVSLGSGGCGSSGEQADASLTKGQFQEKADKICNNASLEQFKVGSEYLNAHKGVDEADVAKVAILPPLEKELRKLQELPLPSGYEAQIESFLGALDEAMEASSKDPMSLLSKQNNPFEKANTLGKKYQLGDCGLNP